MAHGRERYLTKIYLEGEREGADRDLEDGVGGSRFRVHAYVT
jgi:hypothetical protein